MNEDDIPTQYLGHLLAILGGATISLAKGLNEEGYLCKGGKYS